MSDGVVITRISRKRHVCHPPRWRQRRKLDLDYGSVWGCACGEHWMWGAPWGESEWMRVCITVGPSVVQP